MTLINKSKFLNKSLVSYNQAGVFIKFKKYVLL